MEHLSTAQAAREILATQGHCLTTAPHSPLLYGFHHEKNFARKLTYALLLLQQKDEPRREIYGDEADDSRLGHTPPETRDRFDSDEHEAVRGYMRTQHPVWPESLLSQFNSEATRPSKSSNTLATAYMHRPLSTRPILSLAPHVNIPASLAGEAEKHSSVLADSLPSVPCASLTETCNGKRKGRHNGNDGSEEDNIGDREEDGLAYRTVSRAKRVPLQASQPRASAASAFNPEEFKARFAAQVAYINLPMWKDKR